MAARLYPMYHSRLEIEEDGARDVARVVGLVEEDILAVAAFGRVGCEITILIDAVFLAELLPELGADCAVSVMVDQSFGAVRLTAVTALAGLERDDFAAPQCQSTLESFVSQIW